ncbi:uncharacterized protein LOC143607299 isoform X2 [Bidens hawaiensis]|uniref:uncharacterized protein LOC143607299 isoform X2 n=1 Tax=Bidens hawaiensis TaxID=980011 RepID=UPI004049E713
MAVEVKQVYYRKKKKTAIIIKPNQIIDHIPNCFQLPRTPSVSKPRTVFYLPICSFKELERDPRGSKDKSNRTQDGRRKTLTDVKSFGKGANLQSCSNRNNENKDDALEVTPSRSREVYTTPGNVVWAKTDGEFWWPAEILGEVSNPGPSVLVRPFGKQGSVSVDPAVDLSPFEECFEERRCNQAKEFQNALEQALQYKEQHTPCKDLFGSPEGSDVLNHHDQSHERDNSSGSSRARSKRERKPKVHFDEVSRPLHTSRKVRRFKIMRSLGLAAPVGSPFNSLSSF